MWLMPAIIAVALVGVVVLILSFLGPREKAGDGKPGRNRAADPDGPDAGGERTADRAPLLTRLLSVAGLDSSLQQTLLAAGFLVRPSELVAVSLGAGCAGFAGAMLATHSWLAGTLAAVLLTLLPVALVNFRVATRRREFERRLPEALELIATALRSGYTFSRALQLVAKELPGPVGEEAQRFTDELMVGLSTDQALDRLSARQPSYDVKLFAAAVQIQTRVGGNLAEVLLKTAAMVRERFQLQSEIRALTAEGRLSAGVLAAIPIFLAVVVSTISRGYLVPLLHEPLGRYMIIAGVVLWCTGLAMIRKMVQVDL